MLITGLLKRSQYLVTSLVLISMGVTGCNLSTSIRKGEKRDSLAPDGAQSLTWVQSTPRNAVGVTATWTVSTSPDLANQKIQFYSDSTCSATSGTLIDLASKTTSTQAFVGVHANTYSFKISSIDTKGNTSVSGCSTPMLIDTVAPSIAVSTAPTYIYNGNNTAYVVTGTCSDATSGISGNVTVSITDGVGTNTATGTCAAFSGAGISVNTTASAMANGTANISITAQVSDAATNSTTSAIVTRSKDTTNPSIAVSTAPTWINNANKTAYIVTGTCSDAHSGLSGNVTVSITDGTGTNTATGTCAAFSGAGISVDTTPNAMADGSSNISVTAQVGDLAGNSSTSAVATRSKDVVNPTLTLTSGSIPTWINNSNKTAYPIIGTCSDATSGISGNVSIDITDGVNSKTVTATCAAYAAGITVNMTTGFAPAASLVDGSSNISITSTVADVATNSTTTATITRSKDTVDPTVVSITSTTADGTYTNVTPDVIGFTITYSENVTVTGAAFTLNTVSTTGSATCTNITNTNTQTCSYTVTLGQGNPVLDYLATNSLTVTSMTDIASNSGDTTLDTPGGAGSIADASVLDVNPPELRWEVVSGTALSTTFDYGSSLYAHVDQTFILRNYRRGQTTSILGNATLSGTNATSYSIVTDNCTGTTLAYNSTCTVIVRFLAGTQIEGTFNATVTTSATVGGSAAANLTGNVLCPAVTGKTSYTTATTGTTYTVPGGCTKITAHTWGAGGGSTAGCGGSGAYVRGTIAVNPGDVLDVGVGGGGGGSTVLSYLAGGVNGGGSGATGGGGYSYVSKMVAAVQTYLLVAGGGGGDGQVDPVACGGGGGALSGLAGASSTANGGGSGGGIASGGIGGFSGSHSCSNGGAGSSLQGGNSDYTADGGGTCYYQAPYSTGGGGGGGYFGGGAGNGIDDSSALEVGGGGGGSSYISPTLVSTTALAGTSGLGANPGGSAVSEYPTNAGKSGDVASGKSGYAGAVVLVPSATYAYIADTTDVYKCVVNPSNGALSECLVSNGGATFSDLRSIEVATINGNTYAYVADNSAQTLYHCSVASVGGALSACTAAAGSIAGWYPQSVTVTQISGIDYAFVGEDGTSIINTCTIDTSNGSFTVCTPGTAGGGVSPSALAFNNVSGANFIYAAGYSNFKRCTLNGSNVSSACVNDAGAPLSPLLAYGISIGAINGTTRAYIAMSGTVNDIQLCAVNTGSGAITGCAASNGGASFASPYGITMDSRGKYIYSTDASGAWVCSINQVTGALTTCTANNGGATFVSPTGITIH